MGIVHFAPIGASPGAITSALAYLRHHPELRGSAEGDIVQDVVIFCSHQVYEGQRSADEFVWNTYGLPAQRQGWKPPRGRANVIQIVEDFLLHDKDPILPSKGRLYVWPLDVNDYDACFKAIATATLAMARGDDTGKYVWANMTGGTNILNSALMQVATLSGLIGKLYYTFISRDADRKYLQPARDNSLDYIFKFIPVVKTTPDITYYRVLEVLDLTPGEWVWGAELLNKLKGGKDNEAFENMPFDHFKDQYLNRMAGEVIDERRGERGEVDRPVKINQHGQSVIEYLLNDLVGSLVDRSESHTELVARCREELDKYKREWKIA
jgi:hypothetical protein